jgi:hypothetical protein
MGDNSFEKSFNTFVLILFDISLKRICLSLYAQMHIQAIIEEIEYYFAI